MSGLYTLNLKCQLITPMFMAGADGRTPELRPSEFKGMMRWWWRAIKAESNYKQLLEEENKIFGGTGSGQGKSKVQIKINPLALPQIGQNLKAEYNLNWSFNAKDKELTGTHSGIGYLLYSTVLPRQERKFIKSGFEFELILESNHDELFNQAVASLWLSIYLGGFGTRSRRGGGNLEVISESDRHELKFTYKIKDKMELKNFLKENMQKIKSMMSNSNSKIDYTNLKGAKVYILDEEKDWKDALNSIGKIFQDFRTTHRSEIFDTATFGMPVIHSGSSVRLVPYEVKGINNKRLLSDRWSSPLIFKVLKSGDNYFPIIVKLIPGGLNSIGKEKKVGGKWRLDKNQTSHYSDKLINKFLQTLSDAEELEL